MDQGRIGRLQSSFNLLAPRGAELVDRFYAHLFARHPELRPMFPTEMSEQKRKLLAALVFVVRNLTTPDELEKPLKDMGARHAGFGTREEHYPVVRDTLVSVMGEMAGDQWNSQLQSDWMGALDLVSSVMLAGARAAQTASV